MFSDKYLINVEGREHTAGVETHSQWRSVGVELLYRSREFGAGMSIGIAYIRDVSGMAVGIPEIQAGLGRPVQLIRWQTVTQPVDTIIGKPQDVGARLPIEADRITNAQGERFKIGTVRIHTGNLGITS